MKKTVLLKAITLLVLLFPQAGHTVEVQYKISPVHGLLDFAFTIAGEPYHAAGVLEIYNRADYKSEALDSAVKEIKAMSKMLSNNINFESGVENRFQGTQIRNLIITQSLFSQNLNELSSRTTGLLPIDSHRRFFSALKIIEPVYLELIWKKSQKQLKKHKRELTTQVSYAKLNEMFNRTVKFYGSDWPVDVPFFIGLYPIPYIKDFRNATSSHSMGNIEEHGVMIREIYKSDPGSFGVVFHELCHSVYDAQSFEFMRQLDSYFSKSKNPANRQAYSWFNEAVATAIGNGWAQTQIKSGGVSKHSLKKVAPGLKGKVADQTLSEPWYNDEIIDGYAKGIYPLVLDYFASNKSLDEEFVKKSIEIFSATFPEAAFSFENLLQSVSFVHNKSFLINEDAMALRSHFRTSSINQSAPLGADETIKTAQEINATLFIVVKESETHSIMKLVSNIPFLKDNLQSFKNLKNRSVLSFVDSSGRGYVILVASTKSEFLEGLSNIKKWKLVDSKTPLRTF